MKMARIGESMKELSRTSRAVVLFLMPIVLTVASGGQAQSQHPILDKVADKVVQKYRTTSCVELKAQKAEKKAPSEQEQKAIQFLKSDPQMRAEFINKVAGPIANKMFDCGMIP